MEVSAVTPIHETFRVLAYADLRVRWGVARARAAGLQPTDEFRGLYISDEQVDALLESDFSRTFGLHNLNGHAAEWQTALENARQSAFEHDSRIARLQRSFRLTAPETDALLLALLPEFDRRYESLYAYLQDDVTQKQPSIDLILNLLTDSPLEKNRLREMFRPKSPLLHTQLLTLRNPSNKNTAHLSKIAQPAPSVVSHLLGGDPIDPTQTAAITLQTIDRAPPLHINSDRLLNALPKRPLFSFIGTYGAGMVPAAARVACEINAPLLTVDLTTRPGDELTLTLNAKRDAQLAGAVFHLTGWDQVLTDGRPPKPLLTELLDFDGIVIVSGSAEWQASADRPNRPIFTVRFEIPDFDVRHSAWQQELADTDLPAARVASHFKFTPGQIRDAAATARDLAAWEDAPLNQSHLLAAGRAHSNQKLSELATKITPRYRWEDIILPDDIHAILRELVNTVEYKAKVYEEWGFGRKIALGKGTNALFAGESGTGKTMAADIIANELGLDLYKIDLSTVISKYIGETEKNLGKIFHEAETSNAVLFFDEADALFGKRSEVKDSHDRHANVEVGYLLQRMEAFEGVVILATNLRANLDDAFTRRLHFIIEFPFPDPADRERIWRVNIPKQTPIAEDIDFTLLANRYRLAGGSIRNIILAAAFLAAHDKTLQRGRLHDGITMDHMLHAVRREYQKRGRLIDETLFTNPTNGV